MIKRNISFVAHRGYSAQYLENSYAGIEAALKLGAKYVEFDVQFAAGGVPVVVHDDNLMRLHGNPTPINMVAQSTLDAANITKLSTVLKLLDSYPDATMFVEIKDYAIAQYGLTEVSTTLWSLMAEYGERCVLIAYDADIIVRARQLGQKYIGWVSDHIDQLSQRVADRIQPDWLFADSKQVNGVVPYTGNWNWVLYDITDPVEANTLYDAGFSFIETWDIAKMLRTDH